MTEPQTRAEVVRDVVVEPPRPTCTVRVYFPRRPEHFAYLITEGRPFRFDRREAEPRIVTLTDIDTVSVRETLPSWFFKAGGRLVHFDGRPYTDEELDARHPDPHAVDEALKKISMRRLSFI